MYKHVAKQRRLASQSKEAHLSDEDSSGDELEQEEVELASESGSEGEEDEDDEGEGEDLLPSDDNEVAAEEEAEEEEELVPPPPGMPTALAALEDSIVAAPVAEGEEVPADEALLCVVCPTKVLKRGKMLEVHLGSKDHKRRLNRFKAHITSPEFPASAQAMDARLVSAQLDRIVLARLSLQTRLGGSAAVPSTSTAAEEAEAAELSKAEQLKAEALAEGISKRQLLRELKHKKVGLKREAKKEKKERLRRNKEKKGEVVEAPARPIKKKPTYVPKSKPTQEEIDARQAMKRAKREAEALAAAAAGGELTSAPVPVPKKEEVPKDEVALKSEGKKGTPKKGAGKGEKRKAPGSVEKAKKGKKVAA